MFKLKTTTLQADGNFLTVILMFQMQCPSKALEKKKYSAFLFSISLFTNKTSRLQRRASQSVKKLSLTPLQNSE